MRYSRPAAVPSESAARPSAVPPVRPSAPPLARSSAAPAADLPADAAAETPARLAAGSAIGPWAFIISASIGIKAVPPVCG